MGLHIHNGTWTAESTEQLITDTVTEVRRRYEDDIVTDEVAGFIIGFTRGAGFPEDISDAVLAALVVS